MNLAVEAGQERAAARTLFAQVTAKEWSVLVNLAAEIVALQEAVATGQVFLVAPVGLEHLQAAAGERRAVQTVAAPLVAEVRRRQVEQAKERSESAPADG